jgi:hypothetical protein
MDFAMRKCLTLILLLYGLLDFSNPFVPGWLDFSGEAPEPGVHRAHQREARPVAIAVEPVRTRLDRRRPSLSRSRLLLSQTSSSTDWTAAPPFRSRSAPPADAAGEND